MRRTSFAPPRRRRSPLSTLLVVILLLLAGLVAYLATVDTEVPTQRIELDVTNEILAD